MLLEIKNNKPTRVHYASFVEFNLERCGRFGHENAIVDLLSLQKYVKIAYEHHEMRQTISIWYDDGHLVATNTIGRTPIAAHVHMSIRNGAVCETQIV